MCRVYIIVSFPGTISGFSFNWPLRLPRYHLTVTWYTTFKVDSFIFIYIWKYIGTYITFAYPYKLNFALSWFLSEIHGNRSAFYQQVCISSIYQRIPWKLFSPCWHNQLQNQWHFWLLWGLYKLLNGHTHPSAWTFFMFSLNMRLLSLQCMYSRLYLVVAYMQLYKRVIFALFCW